ncbi:MAG TPA: LytR C-terminal domain-containing protein [candidate division Zixibacteria bacterium]|nr:LytR C-terminal domain-containing protein [candidate division Zixibacteria bacterium]
MPKRTSTKSKSTSRTSKPGFLKSLLTGSRVLEVVIATAFILVVLYVASISIRVTGGVSKTLDSPDHTIRLQVLNGCGISGLASRTADMLADYADQDIEIKVVDTDNFEIRDVPKSMIISREENKRVATLLAAKLGISASEVVYRPLENNYKQVTVTLVLGADFESINLPLTAEKEN